MQVKRQGVGFWLPHPFLPHTLAPLRRLSLATPWGTHLSLSIFPWSSACDARGPHLPASPCNLLRTNSQCAPQPWRTDLFLPNHYRPRFQCGSKISSGVFLPVPLCSLLVAHELPEILSLPLILLCVSWEYRHNTATSGITWVLRDTN